MSGDIPPFTNPAFTRLSIGSNQFTGTIPSSLTKLTNLQTLYIDNNLLVGTIPDELGNGRNLSRLSNGIGIQRTNCIAPTPSNATTSTTPTNTPSSSTSSTPIAAIAGGVTGSIILIAGIVGLVLFLRNRKTAHALAGPGNETLKKKSEGGKVDNGGNEIAAALVKNSNELNFNLGALPQQNHAVPPIPVTKAGYFSLFPRTTSASHAQNPFISEKKPIGLFEARSSQRPFLTKRRFHMDQKQSHTVNDKIAAMGMMSGHGMDHVEEGYEGDVDVEAVLQDQWGPYFKWSCEQVVLWGMEKRFDESILDFLRQNEIDGSILHSLDRDTMKTEMGVLDFRSRAKLLQGIELLRESLPAVNSGAVGVVVTSPVAPVRGVSRGGIVGGFVEGAAPPAYNNS
ncbi:hypothetical protein HDU76_001734 [Blyttiomyces sp. JEL0837]|nr:hypothetical protein HDU76_001734 [Blyttiomyces sp. JEL0837]